MLSMAMGRNIEENCGDQSVSEAFRSLVVPDLYEGKSTICVL